MGVEFIFHGLLATGLVIIFGLFAGKLFSRLHIPKITGYLLLGVAIGPSGFEIVTQDMAHSLEVVKDLALGMLLFAIGAVFEIHKFREVGSRVVKLTFLVAGITFTLVTFGLYALGEELYFAAVMGSIAITTSPGAALLVTREFNSSGPLTETLILVVGMSNILSILTYQLIVSLGQVAPDATLLKTLGWLGMEIVASIIMGAVVGAFLSWWEGVVEDQAELILAFIAGVILVTGLAKSMGINPLLPALIMGAVTTNLSMMHRLIYVEMRQTEQPLYIAFFVLSGVALDLRLLTTLGWAGLGYMVFSGLGKIGSVRFFWKQLNLEENVGKYLGPSLLAQGGVAIGLAMGLKDVFPDMASRVSSIILTTVIIFEVIGPSAIRWSLVKAGETRN
jgi:Kef-type K+ transport system membrane component KefB